MSKKKIFLAFAGIALICLFCLLFSYLHKSSPYETTVFNPTVVQLDNGQDSLFTLRCIGSTDLQKDLLPTFRFDISSLNGNYYTLGTADFHSRNGVPSGGAIGYVSVLDQNEWKPYFSLEYQFNLYDASLESFLIAPDDLLTFSCPLPLWDSGHYRATIVLCEYDYANKQSASGKIELSFEYDVPDRQQADSVSVVYAILDTANNDYGTAKQTATLNLCLLSDGTVRYIQPDSIQCKSLASSDALYVNSPQGSLRYLLSNYVEQYKDISSHLDKFYLDDATVNEKERLSIIPLSGITLSGWEPGQTYELSVALTENPDGTGAQETIQIHLQFE